jgi:hypothetical protein
VAFKALCWLHANHRKHWLSAARKIARYYKDNPKPKEPGYKFAERASIWYIETQASESADRFSIDALVMLAKTVFQQPGKSCGYIADCALVALFPGTSLSTLIHLRAELKSRARGCG